MNPQDFLKHYFHLQHGVVFNEVKDYSFGTLGYCEKEPSEYWNHFLINQPLSPEHLNETEAILKTYNRVPALYFLDDPLFQDFSETLLKNRYKFVFKDAWMFHDSPPQFSDATFEPSIRLVENSDDLNLFCTVMDQCYREKDPQNPYGELHAYLDVTKDAWLHNQQSKNLIYFIVTDPKTSTACGVGTISIYNQIGYISNVGTLQSVRGQGFGKLAMHYALHITQKRHCTIHALATEFGGFPHKLYDHLGFKVGFTASAYAKL